MHIRFHSIPDCYFFLETFKVDKARELSRFMNFKLYSYYSFAENQGDHTRKTLFTEYKYYAKGSVCESNFLGNCFLLSTKHNTFPCPFNTVIKKLTFKLEEFKISIMTVKLVLRCL